MPKKSQQKSILTKVAPKRVLDKNTAAFRTYGTYKKAADIIERVEFAAGNRVSFRSNTGSTLNSEIDRYGVSSTTAQKF